MTGCVKLAPQDPLVFHRRNNEGWAFCCPHSEGTLTALSRETNTLDEMG